MVTDYTQGQTNHPGLFTHRKIRNVLFPILQPSTFGVTGSLQDPSGEGGIPNVYFILELRFLGDVVSVWCATDAQYRQ